MPCKGLPLKNAWKIADSKCGSQDLEWLPQTYYSSAERTVLATILLLGIVQGVDELSDLGP